MKGNVLACLFSLFLLNLLSANTAFARIHHHQHHLEARPAEISRGKHPPHKKRLNGGQGNSDQIQGEPEPRPGEKKKDNSEKTYQR
jgi:hypothetical protein